MIRSIEFTVKGDYNSIGLRREEGCSKVELQFHYYNGMSMATFDFKDLQKAVEVLSEATRDE